MSLTDTAIRNAKPGLKPIKLIEINATSASKTRTGFIWTLFSLLNRPKNIRDDYISE